MSKELIRLSDCSMVFDDDVILNNINLYIKDKEFLTLLGPSGCGKTTTLRLIGGFLTPTSGDVLFDGKRINDVPPHKRAVNTVFQKYALFPNLNVFDNVAFGLRIPKTDENGKKVKLSQNEIQKQVMEMLELVNLKGFEKRSVTSLSGGQQQRVAIARAIIQQPKVLLLDEPLGALDLKLRKEMQVELKKLHETLDMTFLYVTHDQEEALTMSDTVVVMNQGEILQQGTPIDIYNEPANAFVADFIGQSNIIPGIMRQDRVIEFLGTVYDCVDTGFSKNEPVDVVIRPEDLLLIDREDSSIQPEDRLLKGRVTDLPFKGVHYDIIAGLLWLQVVHPPPALSRGRQNWHPSGSGRVPHHEKEPLFRYVRRLQLLQRSIR